VRRAQPNDRARHADCCAGPLIGKPSRRAATNRASVQQRGCKWLIEVDVQGFFDTINHGILLKLLEKRIDDHKFIDLLVTASTSGLGRVSSNPVSQKLQALREEIDGKTADRLL
jgi:hypothetical protein